MFMVSVDAVSCDGCGECVAVCPASMLEMVDDKAVVTGDAAECLGCETCVVSCTRGAVRVTQT